MNKRSIPAIRMHRSALLWMVAWAAMAVAQNSVPTETTKIEYLIAQIEALQGADFIRNGASYTAKAAADHLRMKWHAAGSHVTTADDFIRICATASSVSGIPYRIRFTDGRVLASADFLQQKLADYALVPPHPSPHPP